MKKILIINTAGLAIGGITTNIYNYLSHIDRNDLSFDLVVTVLHDDISVNNFLNLGCKLHFLCNRKKHTLQYMFELARLVRHNKYDVIHIHANSHAAVIDLLGCYMGGCNNCIVHAHNTTCNSKFLHNVLSLPFKCLCKGHLACSEKAGKFMFGSQSFCVLPNGIDVNLFSYEQERRFKIRKYLNIADDEILVGHVGIFMEIKNHKFLVNLFAELMRNYSNYKLCLIGDGPLKGTIKTTVENRMLSDKVIFTGNIKNVYEYLNAFDIIVMPSLYEGLPLALVEQQANGLPCVCSDTITQEVNMSGNIKFLSLNAPLNNWIQTIVNIDCNDRASRSKKAIECIQKYGYDIQYSANTLKQYYEEIMNM